MADRGERAAIGEGKEGRKRRRERKKQRRGWAWHDALVGDGGVDGEMEMRLVVMRLGVAVASRVAVRVASVVMGVVIAVVVLCA